MPTLKRLHRQAKARRTGSPAFTLLELIVVLLVLGILAAIAVPTFNRVKENSVVRTAQSTLEAAARNGEAIARSDGDATDEAIAASVESEFADENGLTVSVAGDTVTVSQVSGSITASGSVEFNGGVATITAAAISGSGGGSSSTTSTTVAPTTTTTVVFSLSYASTAFSTSQTSQTRAPSVSGGTASSFSYSGALPTGVSFDTSTGVFTGPSAWNFQATQISAGSGYTCALTTSGGAKCWGSNSSGELGDGTTNSRSTPVDVSGLTSGVASIAAGIGYTCAVVSGGAKCWGANSFGKLGDGTTTQRLTPVDVLVSPGGSPLTGVTSISTGANHACVVTTSGGAKCWGYNNAGALGDGTTTDRSTPVDVLVSPGGSPLTSVASISAGDGHTCAVVSGGAKCWGANSFGKLGDGTTTLRLTPVDVSGLTSGVASVDTGQSHHTCAATTSGGAKCWGRGSDIPRLGDAIGADSSTPVDVLVSPGGSPLTGVASISTGANHACVVTTSGGAKCWGWNSSGRLGDGTTTQRSTPVDVSGLTSGAAQISAGDSHTCALTASGGVKCWGWTTASSGNTPVNVSGLTGNPGWPASITVTVTASDSRTADANVTLTNS